jgi:hypothetical protein
MLRASRRTSGQQGYSAGEGHQPSPILPNRNRGGLAFGLVRAVAGREEDMDEDGQNPGSSAFIIASREHDPLHAVGDERYRRERRAIKWMLEKMK